MLSVYLLCHDFTIEEFIIKKNIIMKNLKPLFLLILSSVILFSCMDNIQETNISHLEDISVTSRSLCHDLYAGMGLTIPFDNNECMNDAHTRLEEAIQDYNANSSDYNLYLVFNFWINYYRTAVDCFGCEATDCEAYLVTGQQMIDCLIQTGSPNVASLQDIYSWLEGNCEACSPECCDDAELVLLDSHTYWSDDVEKFCCSYKYEIVGDCPEAVFDMIEVEDYTIQEYLPTNKTIFTNICGDSPRQRYWSSACGLDTGWLGDCINECCENVSFTISQTPTTNGDGCCTVAVNLVSENEDEEICTSGWDLLYLVPGQNPINIQGEGFVVSLCGEDQIRLINLDCQIDTGWISADCKK